MRARRQTFKWQAPLVQPVPFNTIEWQYPGMTWTDDRLEFIGREFTAGTPIEIIDNCLADDGGRQDFTGTDLDELIEARGWVRPPGWDEAKAWKDWNAAMDLKTPADLGPFGVRFDG